MTFNPAIDYVLEVKDLRLGKVNRSTRSYKYPGGKGINISRVLKNLSVENIALGFIGGFTGAFIEEYLKDLEVRTNFIPLKEDTRINVKIKGIEETDINDQGPQITEEDLRKFFKKLEDLKEEDFLILSGNIQSSLPRDTYSKIQDKCRDKNIKIIVDTTGEALMSTLKYNPFLIKPNQYELGEIFGVEIKEEREVIQYSKKLLKKGTENVLTSLGSKGAILISKDGLWKASAPEGSVKNSVGAGDSMVAGFVSSYSKNKDIEEAFKWAVAAGSATAFSWDLCTKEKVMELLPKVRIEKIS